MGRQHEHTAGKCTMTCSMEIQHVHAHAHVKRTCSMEKQQDSAWTCSIDMHLGDEARTGNMDMQHDMQHGQAARTCRQLGHAGSMEIQHGHTGRTQHGHAAWKCRKSKQKRHAAHPRHAGRTCSMDVQNGQAAGTCSMDVQNGQQGHANGHAA